MVRAFDDDDITSVSGKVDPIEDIDTINLELVMADLDAVNKRLAKVQRAAKGRDKDALAELAVLNKIKPALEDGKSVRSLDFSDDEKKIVKGLFLLTSKPVLYVANIAEDDMADPDANKYMDQIKEHVKDDGEVIGVAAAAEEQIAEMDDADKADRAEPADSGGLQASGPGNLLHCRGSRNPGLDLPEGYEGPSSGWNYSL